MGLNGPQGYLLLLLEAFSGDLVSGLIAVNREM